jgi:hypothetical protein
MPCNHGCLNWGVLCVGECVFRIVVCNRCHRFFPKEMSSSAGEGGGGWRKEREHAEEELTSAVQAPVLNKEEVEECVELLKRHREEEAVIEREQEEYFATRLAGERGGAETLDEEVKKMREFLVYRTQSISQSTRAVYSYHFLFTG